MKKLDIPALEIFVAAVEEKSLSKAAERENLVTSAASKRVAELERHLERTLLHRHGRGVEPTPAGTLLYQRAKAILRSVQLTESAINGYSADGQAKIRLASNPSTILQFLPDVMGRFLADRRDVSVDLLDAHSYDIPRLVAETSVDIGIYHADHPVPGVASFPFRRDRVGLVVPVGHPLAGRGELFLEEALDYDLLGYFPRHSLDQFLAYAGQTLTRPPNVKLQVSNFETRCRMIREGLGIGIVPEGIARNYLASMGLALLRLRDAWAERQFYVCVRDAAQLARPVEELLRALTASTADAP
ncbi:HTH-type transcriptional regulator CysL [Achromobacter anxifer]|uniref:HTH-type transcriptional regulator CysL n=1 Tax=Achromobacter anxifer TaxID=1287737 RepID=A0A6S7CI58_9BURK|nr:LysR family transcriptional regulator [Achromobacter anxifer]CAB3849426.1 HTH-type transcriptional regulator CysL [Achromobacter anxifer]CAB5513701.1 HTH-type transcriptional regulator CysL [Achromobacter anxifer]